MRERLIINQNHRTNLCTVQDMVRGKWSRLRTWLRYCLLGGLMVHRELLLPCRSATVTSSWPYASRNCKALWKMQATVSVPSAPEQTLHDYSSGVLTGV